MVTMYGSTLFYAMNKCLFIQIKPKLITKKNKLKNIIYKILCTILQLKFANLFQVIFRIGIQQNGYQLYLLKLLVV